MAGVSIHYGSLDAAADKARKISSGLTSYADELNRKVRSQLNDLPGSDGKGYVANTRDQVNRKISALRSSSISFGTLGRDIDRFVANAREADHRVACSIKSQASAYVGKRNVFQRVGDWIYNTIFVDWANANPFFRLLANTRKTVWDWGAGLAGKAYEWFKHGDGKYVWNITVAVLGIAAAVIAVIGTSGFALFLAVAALAIAAINGAAKIYNNSKALAYRANGEDPAKARYYGNISSVSDAISKYDMGDADDNKTWANIGIGIDTAEVVVDLLSIGNSLFKVGSSTAAAKAGKKYEFSWKNAKKNFKSNMGFDHRTKTQTFKGFVGSFGLDTGDKWIKHRKGGYSGAFGKVMNEMSRKQMKTFKTLSKGVVFTSNAMSTVEKIDNVVTEAKYDLNYSTPESAILSVSKTVVGMSDALGKFSGFKSINQVTVKPYKTMDKAAGVILEDVLKKDYLDVDDAIDFFSENNTRIFPGAPGSSGGFGGGGGGFNL